MQNITIGRYSDTDLKAEYAGWIEGVREDGTGWILWLDGQGNPSTYWPVRESDGSVIGDPVPLMP